MNVWIASILWQFQLTMLRLWVCKYFFETLLAVQEGGAFLENELLEHVVILPLCLRKCCILFFNLLVFLLFALTRKTSVLVHFMWYFISKSLTLAICMRSAVFVLSHFVT